MCLMPHNAVYVGSSFNFKTQPKSFRKQSSSVFCSCVVLIVSDKLQIKIISVEYVLSGVTGGVYCISSRPSAGEKIHEAAVNRGA